MNFSQYANITKKSSTKKELTQKKEKFKLPIASYQIISPLCTIHNPNLTLTALQWKNEHLSYYNLMKIFPEIKYSTVIKRKKQYGSFLRKERIY